MTSARRTLRLDNVIVPLDAATDTPGDDALRDAVAARLGLAPDALDQLTPLKRSIDPRGVPRLVYSVNVVVERRGRFGSDALPKGVRDADLSRTRDPRLLPAEKRAAWADRVVVIGAGPAGLFAAMALAQSGLRPVIIERGKPVESRARDVSRLMNHGELQHESNLCFGEGGAGTWSDGKLTTRLNAPQVRHVLTTLVDMGAPDRILLDGKPHLGTDRLIKILKAFRAALIEAGAVFRFDTRVIGVTRDASGRLTGLDLHGGEHLTASAAVLAVGHSSHALYRTLLAAGVAMIAKPFAVGFRVEHPQAVINDMQYGRHSDHPALPAADYRLTANVADRGVYSFCMCPGGQVVPTPTTPDGVVVNGMSHAARSGKWANSALVVTVSAADFGQGVLDGLAFQRRAERRAGAMGGGLFRAPASSVADFIAGRKAPRPVRKTSYTPGVTPADLRRAYPEAVCAALEGALRRWGARRPAFLSEDAVLIGVETRTSAPVQITRGPTLESVNTPGLYPCGEGAGYGGGIVSAAVDGLKVADALIDSIDPRG